MRPMAAHVSPWQVVEALQLGLQAQLQQEDEDLAMLDGRMMMAQLRGEGRMQEAAAVQVSGTHCADPEAADL